MSEAVFPLIPIRQLFIEAIPADLFVINLPELRYLYVPSSHFRALHPDSMLVEGIRGAGKSLWWNALQNRAHRGLIHTVLPQTQLAKADCSAGFGVSKSANYPSGLILQQLQENFDAFYIWYTIVAWNLLRPEIDLPETWDARIAWVQKNLERIENYFLQTDRKLQEQEKIHLVLFDALDRAAQNWQALHKLLKGLLSLLLEFRAYRAIRLKAFIRPDMLEDKAVLAFPDSSKIIQNKVSLEWPRSDLYSLLWHYLGNEPKQGYEFRDACSTHFLSNNNWKESQRDIWQVPDAMHTDEILQRKIFDALAGEWMGKDARRGFPYTWLPNHLGDSYAKVSPRSFLAALRAAAADKLRKEQKYPLHYEAIKKGVQQASAIRVDELREDYPWVGELLQTLKGITLPCEFDLIQDRWEKCKSLEKLTETLTETGGDARHLPTRLDQNYKGVKQDLVELGIFQIKRDERIDMPDVYRVGYGLGRKGGVKPVR